MCVHLPSSYSQTCPFRSVFLEVDHRHPDMVENWLQAHPDLLLVLRAIHKDFCGK